MENIGTKLYILHGYWNTSDADGVTIIGVGPAIGPLLESLEEIKSNNAADFVELHQGELSIESEERIFEVMDERGSYAKFYITEQTIPVQNEYEYVAFVWSKTKEDYVPEGRGMGNEALCRARLDEKIEKGWLPDYLDDSRVQIRKRQIGTIFGEWEVIL